MLIKFESCELTFIEVAKDSFFGGGRGGGHYILNNKTEELLGMGNKSFTIR